MRKTLKKVIATVAAGTLAFALAAGVAPTTADAAVECSKAGKKAGKAEVNLDGTYHAYFGFQQTDSWTFRNAWYEPTLGMDGDSLKEPATYDQVLTTLNVSDAIPVGGTVADAEIKGNGTYTVGVTGLDVSGMVQDATKFSLIFASTDIPSKAIDDGTITISDVKLSIDGSESWSGDPYVNADAKEWGLYQFDVINTYQQDGYTSPTILMPTDSIEITFTVSGFNYDNPDAVEAEEAPAEEPAAGAATEEADDSEGGSAMPIVIAVVAVVVIAGVVIVVKKKRG